MEVIEGDDGTQGSVVGGPGVKTMLKGSGE